MPATIYDEQFQSLLAKAAGETSPEGQAAQRGIIGQVAAGAARGALGIPQLVTEAASAIPGVAPYAEPVTNFFEQMKPASSGKPIERGVEMGVTGVGVAGTMAVGGPAIGLGRLGMAAATGGLIGASTLAQTKKKLEGWNQTLVAQGVEPLSDTQINLIAIGAGTVMGAGQALIGRVLNGALGKAEGEAAKEYLLTTWLPKGAQAALAKIPGATTVANVAGVDIPTFATQSGVTAGLERGALSTAQRTTLEQSGQPVPTAGQAAAEIVGPAAVAAVVGAAYRGLHGGGKVQPMQTPGGETTKEGVPPPPPIPPPAPPGTVPGTTARPRPTSTPSVPPSGWPIRLTRSPGSRRRSCRPRWPGAVRPTVRARAARSSSHWPHHLIRSAVRAWLRVASPGSPSDPRSPYRPKV